MLTCFNYLSLTIIIFLIKKKIDALKNQFEIEIQKNLLKWWEKKILKWWKKIFMSETKAFHSENSLNKGHNDIK